MLIVPFYIGEVMRQQLERIEEEERANAAVRELRDKEVDVVLVTNEDEPVGVFSTKEAIDLISHEQDPSETVLNEIELSPVVSIDETEEVDQAAKVMNRDGLRYLLVTKANELIGYLTDRDVTRALADSDKENQ